MRIIICNERLIPRFGVDRVLLIIGRHLVALGHDVAFVCLRAEREAIHRFSTNLWTLSVPSGLGITKSEDFAADWLRTRWADLIAAGQPELLVTGGWPFFCAAKVALEKSVPSAFIDAGAVPHHGLSDAMLQLQQDLRRVRFLTMPLFTAIFPISRFISESQTLAERGHDRGVSVVPLGADHLEHPLFYSKRREVSVQIALNRVDLAVSRGCRLIMALGRYEPVGYKNSPAVFEVFSRIVSEWPSARLLVLARGDEIRIPDHLASAVICVGFIDDQTLHGVMQRCDLGISTSLWEGFNLPLAEMQWGGRPVLAFALGAHPELILDPWYLCSSIEEMANKAQRILASSSVHEGWFQERVGGFREAFKWQRPLAAYMRLLEGLVQDRGDDCTSLPLRGRRLVLADCTDTAATLAGQSVERVARSLTAVLQEDDSCILILARWCPLKRAYVVLDEDSAETLAWSGGPADHLRFLFEAGEPVSVMLSAIAPVTDLKPILLITDEMSDGECAERILWARGLDFGVAVILYDLISIVSAERASLDGHVPGYLLALEGCDAVAAISQASMSEFEAMASRHDAVPARERQVIRLPGQIGRYSRVRLSGDPNGSSPMALCIASVEPRKNHRMLLRGFLELRRIDPEIGLQLILVGRKAPDQKDLAAWLEAQVTDYDFLQWMEYVPNEELVELLQAAYFTVYPPTQARCGLPVLESLWMCRPCLCHNAGVTATLAVEGGCLTVDMSNPMEIATGMQRMVRDKELYDALSQQILRRPIPSWEDYGKAILAQLQRL